MATTDFVDGVTVIEEEWCDHLDNFFYGIFGGATYASQVFSIASNGDVSILDTAGGTALFVDVSANQLQIGRLISTGNANIDIGAARTGNGSSFLDFIGDTTYTDFGLRIIRTNSGANTDSEIIHRGTGLLQLIAQDAGSIDLQTNATSAVRIDSSQNVGIGATTPLGKLHIDQSSATGAIPVLYLAQSDVSEEIFQISSTAGTGNAVEAVGAKTLTTTHFIKITLNGLTRYIPCGTIA